MDHTVAWVQTRLYLIGHFTVVELPVPVALDKGRFRTATGNDVGPRCWPRVGGPVPARSVPLVFFSPAPELAASGHAPDLILADVKEGQATLNGGARSPAVRNRLAPGRSQTGSGLNVRLVAFGSTAGERSTYHAVALGAVFGFLPLMKWAMAHV